MNIIILCAGYGKRIKIDKPKCLLKVNGEVLLDRTLRILKQNSIKRDQIYIALGYQSNKIIKHTKNRYKYSVVRNFKKTNMVYSLFNCLKKGLSDDAIILYGDIFYSNEIIKKIIKAKNQISTVIDINWKKKWKLTGRMENDLETLKIKNSLIIDIGKKTKKIKDIDGRYIGATKLGKDIVNFFTKYYEKKIKKKSKKFLKLDMTSLLMNFINLGFLVNHIKITTSWFEFDNQNDIMIFKKKFNNDYKKS